MDSIYKAGTEVRLIGWLRLLSGATLGPGETGEVIKHDHIMDYYTVSFHSLDDPCNQVKVCAEKLELA